MCGFPIADTNRQFNPDELLSILGGRCRGLFPPARRIRRVRTGKLRNGVGVLVNSRSLIPTKRIPGVGEILPGVTVRVAGWANDYVRELASAKGVWPARAFDEQALAYFLDDRIIGEAVTKHKMLTNYRYMLESAGVLVEDELQPENLRQRWYVDAVQLFWDRQIFDGALPATSKISALEDSLIDHEVFKMLRCDKDQCRAFARAAYAEYSIGQGPARAAQIDALHVRGLLAS